MLLQQRPPARLVVKLEIVVFVVGPIDLRRRRRRTRSSSLYTTLSAGIRRPSSASSSGVKG
jgi:hypothetical protein